MNNKNLIGQFHGKEIDIILDKKLDRIILPESFAKYILKLEENNEKYKNVNLNK